MSKKKKKVKQIPNKILTKETNIRVKEKNETIEAQPRAMVRSPAPELLMELCMKNYIS